MPSEKFYSMTITGQSRAGIHVNCSVTGTTRATDTEDIYSEALQVACDKATAHINDGSTFHSGNTSVTEFSIYPVYMP